APPPVSAASPPAGAGPPPSAPALLGTPAPEINQVTVEPSPPRHHRARRGPRATIQPVIPATPLEGQSGVPAEVSGQVPKQATVPPARDAKTYAHGAARLRTHVVRPGESLWSIARASLGGNPSDAEIASQVHRLWELNKDQIRTGNPDLLMAGTKLKLP
ncbi:MAG: LysM peptidoglycan-binding domain-containing protein, partial [Actinomycetota bacterium]|nr:LysM peptidoglycan-binding domain-containing protein [Actinomycetota bacterium]